MIGWFPYQDDIAKFQSDAVSRLALGYAIANYVPLCQARQGAFAPLIIKHEDLVMQASRVN